MLPYHLDIAVQYGLSLLILIFPPMENDFQMITFSEDWPLPRQGRVIAALLNSACFGADGRYGA